MSQSQRDPIRVLMVDDHTQTLRGYTVQLAIEPDIEVVALAEDGAMAVAQAEEYVPDVILMDIWLPGGMSGIEATAIIKDRVPSAQIVMMTASDEENDVLEALRAGASGYLHKSDPVQLADGIRQVAAGESPISPSLASRLLVEMVQRPEEQPPPARRPELTPRELEVLRLVADGLSNREIAAELFISENTVRNHVRNILEKLHKHSRMEAVMFAVRGGILDLN
jgi:DNA-binding NarL/FixJ family response regulator